MASDSWCLFQPSGQAEDCDVTLMSLLLYVWSFPISEFQEVHPSKKVDLSTPSTSSDPRAKSIHKVDI
jgi:hypothetical protein